MAIQIPNPGTGNGASGDNEFVLWTKTKDNFSNTTHAASRLVGVDAGNVLEMGNRGIANSGLLSLRTVTLSSDEANKPSMAKPSGFYRNTSVVGGDKSNDVKNSIVLQTAYTDNSNNPFAVQLIIPVVTPYGLFIRRKDPSSDEYLTATESFYSNFNTTKDSNGFIKAASPIVKVFADKVELNYDAEKQDVTYTKNGIGDYTITTVSGLSTDGWYIELPKDMNGNPKVAVTLTEVDGVISLKSYKRIFSMETFTFEPDLDNPLDIPDTRWIDLRLNEIHVEMPDDTQTEV